MFTVHGCQLCQALNPKSFHFFLSPRTSDIINWSEICSKTSLLWTTPPFWSSQQIQQWKNSGLRGQYLPSPGGQQNWWVELTIGLWKPKYSSNWGRLQSFYSLIKPRWAEGSLPLLLGYSNMSENISKWLLGIPGSGMPNWTFFRRKYFYSSCGGLVFFTYPNKKTYWKQQCTGRSNADYANKLHVKMFNHFPSAPLLIIFNCNCQ